MTVLNKGDIARNAKTACDRVITAVTLALRAVTKKNTRNELSRELYPLTRWQKDITQTPEHTKMDISRRTREQTLARTTTLKISGGLKVNEVNSGGDSFSPNPKVGRNMRSKEKSASGLNDMAVLSFRGAILRMSTGRRAEGACYGKQGDRKTHAKGIPS